LTVVPFWESGKTVWRFHGEYLNAIRVDMAGDPNERWLNIAWKFIWTAKDSWLVLARLSAPIPAVYNLIMDPFERYDMIFNGAEGEMNNLKTSPGRYAGEDNGWSAALFSAVLLQHPKNPVPALDPNNLPKAVPSSD